MLSLAIISQLLLNHLLRANLVFFLRFYLFIRDREREAETQAEGVAGSIQGAQSGIRSWILRITPWAEGRRSTAEPPGVPSYFVYYFRIMRILATAITHEI